MPDRRVERPLIDPVRHAEGKHVPAAVCIFGANLNIRHGLARHPAHRDAHDLALARDHLIIERVVVLSVSTFFEVTLGKLVLVDNDQPADLDIVDVGFKARGVHREHRVDLVARRKDLVARELELEPGDPKRRAFGCPDLGWEIGEGGDVVAEDRAGGGELEPL